MTSSLPGANIVLWQYDKQRLVGDQMCSFYSLICQYSVVQSIDNVCDAGTYFVKPV
jgi:hypothetical protein